LTGTRYGYRKGFGESVHTHPIKRPNFERVLDTEELTMKKLVLALAGFAAFTGSAIAADLPARYSKAPALVAPAYNWTGIYIFGGAGGGLWNADSNVQSTGVVGGFGPAGTAITRDQRMGGSGWFGTVGIGYDWQFNGPWVAGIFGDGQFGDIRGSLVDVDAGEGREKLRTSYAAGVRLGYLVAPNVLSYVNGGYSGSEWSGTTQTSLFPPFAASATTPSFRRDGWFVGGGVENNLNIFGISAPGWFMKTEYRSAFYNRISLPETDVATGAPSGLAITFKPWVQTVSTSLVYRFNSGGTGSAMAADLPARYSKAPAPVAPAYNWTGFHIFGGAGGGLWNADSNVQSTGVAGFFNFGPAGTAVTRDQRLGGSGWFGTVGIGYDWQFNGPWVAGIFGDGQFGDIRGSLIDPVFFAEGREKLRTSYAAGVRLGYLVAPQVLSYVNAGYSGSEWSGTTQAFAVSPFAALTTTPSFRRDGWFIGGGVENNLNIFGISAPGWFMKTEYRSAFYDRIALPTTFVAGNFLGGVGLTGEAVTFKPWVQTISTSLVYRFNWGGGPIVAKY
jgi:outer membrane immunogenic protein